MTKVNITTEKSGSQLDEIFRGYEAKIEELQAKVKKMTSKLIAAEQKERKRIARLLHNDLQQRLFSSQNKAKLLHDDVPAEFNEKNGEIVDQIGHCLQLTKQLVGLV